MIRMDFDDFAGEVYDAALRARIGRGSRRDLLGLSQDCRDTARALRWTGDIHSRLAAMDLDEAADKLGKVADKIAGRERWL